MFCIFARLVCVVCFVTFVCFVFFLYFFLLKFLFFLIFFFNFVLFVLFCICFFHFWFFFYFCSILFFTFGLTKPNLLNVVLFICFFAVFVNKASFTACLKMKLHSTLCIFFNFLQHSFCIISTTYHPNISPPPPNVQKQVDFNGWK